MKILYDHQILILQKYGGISRYFYELMSEISKVESVEIDIPVLFSKNYYFEKYFKKESIKGEFPLVYRFSNFVNKSRIIHKLRTVQYDIVHPTYYDPYILKRRNGKLVLTVYDMIHEIFPSLFDKNDNTSIVKKMLMKEADKIIAISQSTKSDILKYNPNINPDKIQVIYLADSFSSSESLKLSNSIQAGHSYKIPSKYILYTGARFQYKNFLNFLNAVIPILKRDNSLSLVCTGGGAFSELEKELFEKAGIMKQVFHYHASDSLLEYLYKQAICFVFPSLYEGFGIPVLEAFSNQCPAILSNTSSLPEIGDNAAVYFDPYNIDDMNQKIEGVVYNEKRRSEMIMEGLKQAKKFTWKKTASETLQLYRELN